MSLLYFNTAIIYYSMKQSQECTQKFLVMNQMSLSIILVLTALYNDTVNRDRRWLLQAIIPKMVIQSWNQ